MRLLADFRFKKKQSRKKAKKALHAWYKNIGRSHIRELIACKVVDKPKIRKQSQ